MFLMKWVLGICLKAEFDKMGSLCNVFWLDLKICGLIVGWFGRVLL